jgi:hypothetical protein
LSRNRDRVGGTQHQDASPPPQQVAQSQHENIEQFAFVVPTEFVELPSQGRFYPEGHPLCGVDTIEIRHMTAKEEDMLTSRTLLKKGIALDRVIRSLIIDKSINPDTLLVGDRNAIIIATRSAGYGNDYDTKVTCPACGTVQQYSFDLNAAEIYNGGPAANMEVTDNENGTFDVVLPKTEITVTFRLLTGADEKRFLDGLEIDRKQKQDRNVTRQLRNIIVAVNNNDSSEAISYLVNNIPSIDSRYLRSAYRLSTPDIDLTQNFICEECNHEVDLEVPLSADFFWPDR